MVAGIPIPLKGATFKVKVACCWSSGKDSCYAYWKAVAQGYDVRYLVNFVSPAGFGRNAFHGVKREIVQPAIGSNWKSP